jgi:Protein of unknown function (DUF3300)
MKTKPFILKAFLLSVLGIGAFATAALAQTTAAPPANAAAPPSAPAQKSQADLEKLVAPIALYPDPLIATLLPASAYPLEIVQAARFVKDTNNVPKLDSQPWDDNVKAVAKFPEVINQMNDNIAWTSDLGDAFINQPKEVMDAIQTMRGKANDSGALKTTPQQIVTVTNTIVTNTVSSQIVYYTNTVVQIQPAQPDVIYVPQYNPTVVYPAYPPYPAYYYPPPGYYAGAAMVSFGIGFTVGAIVHNNCDWHGGGCYHSDVDINVDRDVNRERNVNRNSNVNQNRNNVNSNNRGQKWQPDQNRLKNSGSTMSSAQSREARGYPSQASARNTAATQRTGQTAANRPSTSPSANRPSSSPSANRPSASPSANRPSSSPSANRPASSSSANRSAPSGNYNRPSGGGSSAFSGGSGAQARQASARGAASRGGGGGGRGGGGGGRR